MVASTQVHGTDYRTGPLIRLLIMVGLTVVGCCAERAAAQDESAADVTPDVQDGETPPVPIDASTPTDADGPSYVISSFEIQYVKDNPGHPSGEALRALDFVLGMTAGGYVAPRASVTSVRLSIADVDMLPDETYYASAIQHILEGVRDDLVELGLIGIYVAPDPFQISEEGDDLRAEGDTTLRLIITTGIVTELRTLASGKRIPAEERVNHPLHQKIRENSPVQPYWGLDVERRDLLRKDLIDQYVFHVSRHPGRRVDVAVSAAMEPGGGALDYIVTENKPLILYAQITNNGTRSTNRLRERFGLVHSQLTDNDDVLELTYATAGFEDTNALAGSYERPFSNDRVHWRIRGSWSEFTASDVGFFNDDFTGDSWSIGGDIIANIYQDRELFIDLVAGVRLIQPEVFNPLIGAGEETFLLPRVALRLDSTSEWMSTVGFVDLEFQIGDLTGVDDSDLTRLGRTLPDRDWIVMHWGINHSVYLEPLLNHGAWQDPTTPGSSTLAHEVRASFRGQYAFDNRLIPQVEQSAGGFRSVRGYPESVTAGDTVLIGSLEYRYHVPRAFEIQPEPREMFGEPFRLAPQYVYGHPDWDLILKGFVDVGRTYISEQLSFEREESLIGIGVGAELRVKRNFRIELDWGFVIEPIDADNVHGGSNRLHVGATFQY